jgi:hypothetical protein
VTLDELEALGRQAANDLLQREGRPVPPAVVVPAHDATRVLTLPDLPDAEEARRQALAELAQRELRPRNASCYGFVAEGLVDEGGVDVEAVVLVYGARAHHPRVTAAALGDDGLGAFAVAEALDHAALPFLAPLQEAVDAAGPPDVMDPAGL